MPRPAGERQESFEVHLRVLKFPAPKWHADDGGRYIGTECLVIVKDPDSDWVNLGTYRVMVHDKTTLVVFIGYVAGPALFGLSLGASRSYATAFMVTSGSTKGCGSTR